MGFSLDEYRDAMLKVEPPVSIDTVTAARARVFDSREALQQAESDIRAAAGSRGVSLEPLYVKLQQAREEALEAQQEFERVGRFAGQLEYKALADQRQREAEQAARLREAEQLKANALEKAAFKEEIRPAWIACGDSPEAFERRFNAPGGLWDAHVAEKVARREREMAASWRNRYLTMHL